VIGRWLLACFTVAAMAACHRGESATDDDESPAAPPAAVATNTAQENGIQVVALQPASQASPSVIGYASVIDASELFSSVSQYAAADAQRRQFAAQLEASRAALARQQILNADDKNVSDRAVQEAAARAATDAASLQAAVASSAAIESAARQRWGATLAAGAIHGSAWSRAVLRGEAALIELAFTGDAPPPATLTLQSAARRPRTARFLAASPRVDARLQHAAYDYLVSPAAEFPVGLSIEVTGQEEAQAGVLVPTAAVVWDNGVATVFVEQGPGHYAPRPISAALRAGEGFIERDLPPGTRVVVSGAQQLLSQIHKPAAE
jgi:membrane fusion protein, multidrug efflux system